jgi:fucose permease
MGIGANTFLIVILYAAFIGLGLPDQVLGVAWPSIRAEFGLPLDFAGILIITTSLGTTISSFSSGWLTRKFGMLNVLLTAAALTACALLIYALAPSWWVIVATTIPLGLGAGAVDSVLNDYVSKTLTSRHMNFLHGFWGIGATLGPAIMTLSLATTGVWRFGIIAVALFLALLFFLFLASRKLFKHESFEVAAKEKVNFNIFEKAPFMSVMFFFIYTALEGAVGVWICSVLIEHRGMEATIAGVFTTIYWGSLTVGRFLNGSFAPKLVCSRVITWSLAGAVLGICLMFSHNNYIILFALIGTGLAFSALYPCMMFETSSRFERGQASVLCGCQVGFSCLGYALGVPLVGFLINNFSLSYFVPILLIMAISLVALDFGLRKVLKIS